MIDHLLQALSHRPHVEQAVLRIQAEIREDRMADRPALQLEAAPVEQPGRPRVVHMHRRCDQQQLWIQLQPLQRHAYRLGHQATAPPPRGHAVTHLGGVYLRSSIAELADHLAGTRSTTSQVWSSPTLNNSLITRRVSSTSGCGAHLRYSVTFGSEVTAANRTAASATCGARNRMRGPSSA